MQGEFTSATLPATLKKVRRRVTTAVLHEFMKVIASEAKSSGSIYFTGGATALLLGLREQTIDIDIKLDPEPAGVFESIARLKNTLNCNVELASPDNFIPATADWRERSVHVQTIGKVQFYHYDLALQALSKIERGYEQDIRDAHGLLEKAGISNEQLLEKFLQIEPGLLRYPAIDAAEFRKKVELFISERGEE